MSSAARSSCGTAVRAIPCLDVERICRAIELTRFPVPEEGDYAETEIEAGLVRAADLIGQLADPAYLRKLAALWFELHEIGLTEKMGCQDPADLAEQYPALLLAAGGSPMSARRCAYLEKTAQGRLWVAQLYAHVFVEEHARGRLGPERGQGRSNSPSICPSASSRMRSRRRAPSAGPAWS